jgi:uncharacterized membrane protein
MPRLVPVSRITCLFVAFAAAALAIAAAPVSPAPAASLNCPATITLLPDLGYGSQALAIRGDTVVGSVVAASGRTLPAYWRDGQLVLITGVDRGYAGDINPAGVIVGNSGFSNSFVVVDGTTHLLPHPPGFAYARRINALGQMAGAVGAYAARWDAYTSQPVSLLPAIGDPFSFAKGINNRGQVAGDTDQANGAPRAAIWDLEGNIRVLASGFGADEPSELFAINNRGVSTGESYVGGDFGPTADQATRWSSDGVPTLIPLLPETTGSVGLQLNDLGWVGGVAVEFDWTTFEETGHHAFIWFGDGPAMTLPVPGRSYADSQSDAHYVTDSGVVVGGSGPAGGPNTATIWTCVREQAYLPDGAIGSSADSAGRSQPRSWLNARRSLRANVHDH